jgi:hypothetical protein
MRGRPSKYQPEYCDRVIELGKQGMSIVEMACDIGVHRETLEKNWPAEHPEFSEAFARARDEAQAWWERIGREGMQSKSIDAAIYSRSMAARFPKDWTDKKLMGSDPDNPLPPGFVIRDFDGSSADH